MDRGKWIARAEPKPNRAERRKAKSRAKGRLRRAKGEVGAETAVTTKAVSDEK